jgi:hypothetical protein
MRGGIVVTQQHQCLCWSRGGGSVGDVPVLCLRVEDHRGSHLGLDEKGSPIVWSNDAELKAFG